MQSACPVCVCVCRHGSLIILGQCCRAGGVYVRAYWWRDRRLLCKYLMRFNCLGGCVEFFIVIFWFSWRSCDLCAFLGHIN